jgi:hypothetical protein
MSIPASYGPIIESNFSSDAYAVTSVTTAVTVTKRQSMILYAFSGMFTDLDWTATYNGVNVPRIMTQIVIHSVYKMRLSLFALYDPPVGVAKNFIISLGGAEHGAGIGVVLTSIGSEFGQYVFGTAPAATSYTSPVLGVGYGQLALGFIARNYGVQGFTQGAEQSTVVSKVSGLTDDRGIYMNLAQKEGNITKKTFTWTHADSADQAAICLLVPGPYALSDD